MASLEDAGIGGADAQSRGSWEVPDSTWEWVMGVNFWGVLYGLQVFVPHMLEHGEEGHIVNTASLAALMPGGSAYSVSKHAVLTLTEGVYQQFQTMGAKLSASVLCPGLVDTNIGRAERNRPSEFGNRVELADDEAAGVLAMLSMGMNPNDVAEQVFEAIVEQRCYILPHPAWDETIRGRVDAVLARSAPFTLDPEEMQRRLAAGEQL